MPERLFLFIQMEFPWALGPPDGRYLLRASAGAEPERVVVLGTLGAARVGPRGLVPGRPGVLDRSRSRRRARTPATPEPAPVATTRATVVDPVSVAVERQARAWLADLDAAHEARAAVAVLNRVLHFHRIACADPYVHEVSGAQALVIRAGWGEGEQVADGLWLHAEELPPQADEAGAGRNGTMSKAESRTPILRPGAAARMRNIFSVAISESELKRMDWPSIANRPKSPCLPEPTVNSLRCTTKTKRLAR